MASMANMKSPGLKQIPPTILNNQNHATELKPKILKHIIDVARASIGRDEIISFFKNYVRIKKDDFLYDMKWAEGMNH
jgi:hypothetical protein